MPWCECTGKSASQVLKSMDKKTFHPGDFYSILEGNMQIGLGNAHHGMHSEEVARKCASGRTIFKQYDWTRTLDNVTCVAFCQRLCLNEFLFSHRSTHAPNSSRASIDNWTVHKFALEYGAGTWLSWPPDWLCWQCCPCFKTEKYDFLYFCLRCCDGA